MALTRKDGWLFPADAHLDEAEDKAVEKKSVGRPKKVVEADEDDKGTTAKVSEDLG